MTETTPIETVDNESKPCTFDPGEQTRLRCVQCGTPVCPKCMVMYEVGFKCKRCVKRIQTHVTEVTPRHLMSAAICAGIAGYFYGWFFPFLTNLRFFMIFGIPVLGLFLAYLVGKGAGNLIYSMTGYKLGRAILSATLLGAITGILLSPFHQVIQEFMTLIAAQQDATLSGTSSEYLVVKYVIVFIAAMLFIRGLCSPLMKK